MKGSNTLTIGMQEMIELLEYALKEQRFKDHSFKVTGVTTSNNKYGNDSFDVSLEEIKKEKEKGKEEEDVEG